MAKTLHDVIIANLDPATNGKGRVVAEYRLRVEQLDGGILALCLHPEGFNSEEVVFGIDATAGSTLTDESTIADARTKIAAAREAEQKARDQAAEDARIAAKLATEKELADRAETIKNAGAGPAFAKAPTT